MWNHSIYVAMDCLLCINMINVAAFTRAQPLNTFFCSIYLHLVAAFTHHAPILMSKMALTLCSATFTTNYVLIKLTLYPSGLTTGTMTNSMLSNNVFTCTGIKGKRQARNDNLNSIKLTNGLLLNFNKSALVDEYSSWNFIYVHLGFFHMRDQVLGKEWAHGATDPISCMGRNIHTCVQFGVIIIIYTDNNYVY